MRYSSLKAIEIGTIRIPKAWVRFPIRNPHSNYGHILYHFRDKARYWRKIAIFSYQPAFHAPVRGSASECCHNVWCRKTLEWCGYPKNVGKKRLGICLGVSRQYWRVTDRHIATP